MCYAATATRLSTASSVGPLLFVVIRGSPIGWMWTDKTRPCLILFILSYHPTKGAQDYVRQAGGAASRRKHLSECFRFGTAIAEVANALLSTLKGETRRLIGKQASTSQQGLVRKG